MENYGYISVEDLPNYDAHNMTFTHPITGVKDGIDCEECPFIEDLKVYFVWTFDEHYDVEMYCQDCIECGHSPDVDKERCFFHKGIFYLKSCWSRCPICMKTPVRKKFDNENQLLPIPYCKKCCEEIQKKHSQQLNHDISIYINNFI
tara:strand:+ start:28 stop:468 length:441 start_codon:yes stop_codon:yes gene_type:complete